MTLYLKNGYFCARLLSLSLMNHKARNLLYAAGSLLFSAFVIYFFGNFCFLRTFAYTHVYKEYLCGVIVLLTFFLNVLVLFPYLYEKNRQVAYFSCTIICTLLAGAVEMALIYPDFYATLSCQFTHAEVRKFILTGGFLVIARDSAFSLSAFAIKNIMYLNDENKRKESALLNHFHSIEARDWSSHQKTLINIDDICFCKQTQNYTTIFLADGKRAIRYGSLKLISDELGQENMTQISRTELVFYKHVLSFNNSGVILKSRPEPILLNISEAYKEKALKDLSDHVGKTQGIPRLKHSRAFPAKNDNKARERHKQAVLDYISTHSECPATEIQKYRRISPSTVNRILAQLKKEGLIEYRGSKKYGGYVVVDS